MFRKSISLLVLIAALGVFGAQAHAKGGEGGSTGDVIVIPNAHQGDDVAVAGGGGNTGDVIITK